MELGHLTPKLEMSSHMNYIFSPRQSSKFYSRWDGIRFAKGEELGYNRNHPVLLAGGRLACRPDASALLWDWSGICVLAELAQKARKEIADYLAAGKDERARIRVEHIIREDYLVEAMEILELYCDLLLARFGLIQSMK